MRARCSMLMLAGLLAAPVWAAGATGAGAAAGLSLPAQDVSPESGADVLDFFQRQGEVSSASKARLDRANAPATTMVVTADDIKRFGYRNVADALRGLPGLWVSYDRDYAYLGARGMSQLGDYGSRVLVLVDGNPVGDAVFNSASIGNELGVDIDQVKRIEVVLGPGSADYGSHAMFTVVNVITKDGADLQGLRLGGVYGAWDSREGKLDYGLRSEGGLDFTVGGSWLTAAGQDVGSNDADVTGGVNNGVFQNGDGEDAWGALAKLGWGAWTLESGVNWRKKGLPNASAATVLYSVWDDDRSFTVDQGNFTELRWRPAPGSGPQWSAKLYHRYYEWEGSFIMQDPGSGSVFTNDNIARSERVGGELELGLEPFRRDHLTLGVDFVDDFLIQQFARNYGPSGGFPQGTVTDDWRGQVDSALYLEDVWQPSEAWTVLGGLRLDAYSATSATLSPRASLLWHFLGHSTAKLLWGTAFSQPVAYTQWNQDGGVSLMADPGLNAEHLQTYEAVFEQALTPQSLLRLSAYQNAFNNMISLVDTTVTSSVAGLSDPKLVQWVNQGGIISRGVELAFTGERAGWKARLGGAVQQSASDQGGDVTNSPQATFSAALSAPLAQAGNYLSVEASTVGQRLSGEGKWIDPYARVDLTFFSASLLPHAELTLKLNNVFDAVYEDPSGEGGLDAVVQDRRNAMAKLSWSY